MPSPSPTRSAGLRNLPTLALLLGLTTVALADSGNLNPRQLLPSYQQECAACHLAYPPGLLPARSWERVMNGLDQHYGTDASLDAATVRQIGQWLRANAGTTKRVSAQPPLDRITESAWFLSKHRKLDAPVWQHASVKSAANCAACHTRAEQGSFDEDELQFPRGLDARYRRAFQD